MFLLKVFAAFKFRHIRVKYRFNYQIIKIKPQTLRHQQAYLNQSQHARIAVLTSHYKRPVLWYCLKTLKCISVSDQLLRHKISRTGCRSDLYLKNDRT